MDNIRYESIIPGILAAAHWKDGTVYAYAAGRENYEQIDTWMRRHLGQKHRCSFVEIHSPHLDKGDIASTKIPEAIRFRNGYSHISYCIRLFEERAREQQEYDGIYKQ